MHVLSVFSWFASVLSIASVLLSRSVLSSRWATEPFSVIKGYFENWLHTTQEENIDTSQL